MSVTKDMKTGRWMSQIRITDWTGKKIHKKKRGFPTKREALQWEQRYLSRINGSQNMLFGDFVSIYMNDMKARLKPSTLATKELLIRQKLLPYFEKLPLNDIRPSDIRSWQNTVSAVQSDGNRYSATYLKSINNQLTAIFNYAVKYYNLSENPCHKAGTIGASHADEMKFWTKQEFTQFLEAWKGREIPYTMFMTLYYTGMREGELLALTPSDIDLKQALITISKTYQRIDRKDLITSPKTAKSKRRVTIPESLCTCLNAFLNKHPEIGQHSRLFPYTKSYLYRLMVDGCKKTGVKRIRIHDLRHSHASLLVEMGCSPLLIAERLGHERVQTTMNIYSHLYPDKQAEVAKQLETYCFSSSKVLSSKELSSETSSLETSSSEVPSADLSSQDASKSTRV